LAPTVGIAATGFGIRAGSFKLSSTRSANFFVDKINKFIIDKISKFFIDKISKSFIGDISKKIIHRQDQQISQLPTAAARSLQQIHPLQMDFVINKEECIKLRDYGVDKSSRR
jgi:hypothetical protein